MNKLFVTQNSVSDSALNNGIIYQVRFCCMSHSSKTDSSWGYRTTKHGCKVLSKCKKFHHILTKKYRHFFNKNPKFYWYNWIMVSLFVLYLCYVILLIFPEYKWWLTVNCICLTRIKTTAKTFCLNLSDTGYNSEKKTCYRF